jgi:hypothetical protein
MDLILRNENFVNNKLYVSYGTRQQAMFTIIDETFQGTNGLGRVNRLTCLVRQLDAGGETVSSSLASLVIGLGDGMVGVASDDATLRGKVLTHENMESCVVTLYEA